MSFYDIINHFSDYRASSLDIKPQSNDTYVIPALRNKNTPTITQNNRILKSDKKYVVPALRKKVPLTLTQNTGRFKDLKPRDMPSFFKNDAVLRKYWNNRYFLFSKYDQGIQLDKESWYSVTPEQIAMRMADRCRCDTIVDGFCGAGGNAIQFAFTCKRVIAIDIDPKKIKLARHNAKIYGVLDRITFICGDFFELVKNNELVGDVVFLSPPWGGPYYYRSKSEYDVETMLRPSPFSYLLATARKISPNVAVFLPRNSNTLTLINGAGPGGKVDIESSNVDDKTIGVTVYYNDLANTG